MDDYTLLRNHIDRLARPDYFTADIPNAIDAIVRAGGSVEFHSPLGRTHVNVKLGDHQMAVTGKTGESPWPLFVQAMIGATEKRREAEEWVAALSKEYSNVRNTGIHDRQAGYCIEVEVPWYDGHFSILPYHGEVWAWDTYGNHPTREPVRLDELSDIIDYIDSWKEGNPHC